MTPRELQAYGKVKTAHDERQVHIEEHRTRLWAISLVDFRNVHFRGRGRAPWTVDDILQPAKQNAPSGMPIADPEELRIKMIMSGFQREEDVPEWARATVAASKAFEQSREPAPITATEASSRVFSDDPEGQAAMKQWIQDQAKLKAIQSPHGE